MNAESRPHGTLLAAFIVGIVVAAAGTATTATLITGKDVKDNSLTGADVRNGSLTGADVRNGSLTGADVRNGSLTGADIRSGSIGSADLSATAKSNLKGDPGARGRQGVAGARGTRGAAGARGAPGNNATGLTMGTTSMTGGATRFAPLGGTGAGDGQPAEAPGITPNVALTMSAMAARAYNLGVGEQIAVTVQVDNVDTTLSCTVTAATSLCEMPGTLSLSPRSTVGIKLLSSAFAGTRVVSWSWTFS